jgi:hypothetical protein
VLNPLKLAKLALLIFCIPLALQAQTADDWWQRTQSLADNERWLDLVHYEASWFGGQNSYIDDSGFFLSEAGASDPAAELKATIEAFIDKPETQCKYVARKLFLRDMSDIDFPFIVCAEYRAWREKVNADSVVLVFASSHLNSPSSMYGHTFLRFDPPDIEEGSTLLSYALNFGANTNESDNGFLYAWKGLAGGYPGLFAARTYFEKVKEYSRLESRDLWEYRLNLSGEEVDRMMAHIWELNLVNFDYFFFDENCSFRLLELIDVARPGFDLADKFPVVAIPIDTVRSVEEAAMVESVFYRPSAQTVLEFGINQLDPSEQQIAQQLSADITVSENEAFTGLSAEKQRDVVSVSYGYLRYLHEDEERDDAVAKRSFKLLRMLSGYEQDPHPQSPPRAEDPLDGHDTQLFSVSGGVEEDDAFADLEWRISYHDLLDNINGYPVNTSLNMGRFVVRAKEGNSLRLQQFDILEIDSLYPRNKFFKPLSWQVNTGFDRQWTGTKNELVPQVNAGVGLSYYAPFEGRIFAHLRTRLEYNQDFDRELDIAGGLRLGYLRQRSYGNTLLQAEHLYFTDGVERTIMQFSHNVVLARDCALRFSYKRSINDSDTINETSLAYRYYF